MISMTVALKLALVCALCTAGLVEAGSGNFSGSPGQTDVIDMLNSLITGGGKAGIYRGGRGVIVRSLVDGIQSKVVPCTLISNDIIAPTTMYVDGNPMCPNKGSSGYNPATACSDDPFARATVGVVMSNFAALFKDGDHIQDDGWGNGVFYGTDSNSADQRCVWHDERKEYDCPGGKIPWMKSFISDNNYKGAGNYESGNPKFGGGGGGAGCHFSMYSKAIDQTDGSVGNSNLVADATCECNYNLKGNYWQDWVVQWMQHATPKPGFEWQKWFFGGGKAPSWGADLAACWVNNPRDMIEIQNAMWWFRDSWNNQLLPYPDQTGRRYWGWNEVPLDAGKADNAQFWDAVVVKLPAAICGGTGFEDSAKCLSGDAQNHLEQNLQTYINKKYLMPGPNNIKNRPGSYMVFLKEWWDKDAYSWFRGFYCENWESPQKQLQVVYTPASSKDATGNCYLDKGSPSPPPPPPPPPPSPSSKTCPPGTVHYHPLGCTCQCGGTDCHHLVRTCCWHCCCNRAEGNVSTIAVV